MFIILKPFVNQRFPRFFSHSTFIRFVLSPLHNSKLYPIEVKSGTNAHLRSLQVFMDNSDIDIAIRVWSNPYSVNIVKTPKGKVFRLINLPFYLIGNLHQILDEVI